MSVTPLPEEHYPHRERAFYSLACNHCEKPVCAEVCPVQAHVKREKDGIVVHTAEKCIYCYACIDECPYGAAKDNPVLERAEKCSLCVERVDADLQPACVLGCPTKALTLVDLATLKNPEAEQYPPGFAKHEALNPSTRFIRPTAPKLVLSEKDS